MRYDLLRVIAVVLTLAIGGTIGAAYADPGAAATSAAEEGQSAKIDVNTAGSAELQTISGIGPALAERIIAFRRENGPFESLEQLLAVKGIGPKLLTRLRERVVVRIPEGKGD
jgi:competence protein ComEA